MKLTRLSATVVLLLSGIVARSQYEVGELNGAFAVNEMGAATYSLPFDIPEGINGMQPSLGLVYNSQSGNGVAGMGMSISGLSVISRTPKDKFHDGESKGLSYSPSDAYAKDGVRMLLKSGTEGADGAIYNVEGMPYDDITLVGSGSSQYFIANLPDGKKAYYGKKTKFPSSGTPCVWYLDTIVDVYDNIITYNYTTNGNCVYLSSVVYGMNEREATSFSANVEFSYENRTDTVKTAIYGKKCNMCRRLKNITVKTTKILTTTTWYIYNLTYQNTDAFSRLKTVTKAYGSVKIPPVTFSWNTLSGFYMQKRDINDFGKVYLTSENKEVSGSDRSNQYFFSGDFLGKGKQDLVVATTYNGNTYLNVYEFGSDNKFRVVSNNKVTVDPIDYMQLGNYVADLDGNGYNKIVLPYTNGMRFYVYASDNMTWMAPNYIDGTSSTINAENNVKLMTQVFTSQPLSTECVPAHTLADFYNCGKMQVAFIETLPSTNGKYNFKLLMKNSNGGQVTRSMQMSFESNPKRLIAHDFNGDGMQDLLVLCRTGYAIYFNQSTTEGVLPFKETACIKNYDGTLFNGQNLQIGDFNGDGLLDFIVETKGDDNWYFLLGNGNGTFSRKLACNIPDIGDKSYTERDNDKLQCTVVDFNNDGKQDVIITKAFYEKKTQWFPKKEWGEYKETYTYWMRSTGNSLVLHKKTTTTNANDALPGHIVVADFNGDGYEEILNFGSDILNASSSAMSWKLYSSSRSMVPSLNKIIGISTANYGTTTSISYASLTDTSVYTSETGSSFPLVDVTCPIHVVKQSTQNAGGDSYTKDYTYSGLRVHLRGRGLLGFKTMSVYDEVNDERVTTTITNLNSEFFIPTEIVTTTSVAGNESSSKTTLTVAKRGTKNYFSYPSRAEQIDIYGNKTTVQNTFDTEYGYQTNQYTSYGTGNNMYKQTSDSLFVKVGGVYKPQIVTETQKHKDASTTFSVKTLYEYDTKGAVVKTTEYANTTPNYHAYTYDVFGNITTHSLWASGINAVTTTYTYDANYRFVTKETSNTSQISINHTYNALDLLVGTSKMLNGNTIESIQYTYDAVGRKSTVTTSPEVTNTTYTYGWGSSAKKRYYVRTESTASPSVTTWYDNIGRTVLTETFGEDSVQIRREKTYGMDGNVSSSKLTEGNISSQTTYVYDLLGRLRISRSNTGNEKYFSYGNKTVTEYDNGRPTIKTYDEWGNVKTITDNEGSTIQYSYNSNGNAERIEADGAVFQMTYNAKGQQTSLTDPDAGITTYTYDALGRIIKQVDYKGITTTNTYNNVGLLTKTVCGDITTNYTYDTQQRLTKESTGSQSISYQYNTKNQLTKKTITIDSTTNLVFRYNYNSLNQLYLMYYPDNTSERYYYDANGNMNRVSFYGQDVWKLKTYTGMIRNTQLRDSLYRYVFRGSDGYLNYTNIRYKNTDLNNLGYTFDKKKNLLLRRNSMLTGRNIEQFTYDSHDRLIETYTPHNGNTYSVDYATNGNIVHKTGIGSYLYESDRPHAVTSVDNIEGAVSEIPQYVTYTPFNKVATVTQGEYSLAITYGPDRQRNKTALSRNDTLLYTRYYADNYEEVHVGDTIYRYYYVYTPDGLSMIAERIGNTMNLKLYSVETDYLGSIVSLYNYKGQTEFRAEYDAWGRQNVVTDNLAHFQRGYCGHEHWHEFDLIDMNGRMYDPVISRFLSPDPFVQAPEDLQNYNRYSYCLNNPLKYTDPSGEFWHIIIGAAIGGTLNWVTHGCQFTKEGLGYFVVGNLAGALGAGVGGGLSSFLGGGTFGAGFIGSSAAQTATSCFVSGATIGAGAGFAGGFTTSFGNGLVGGDGFKASLVSGLKDGLIAGASGALLGGINSGIDAWNEGRNFWDGTKMKAKMRLPFYQQQGELDCRYEVFKSFDTYYNKSTENTNVLKETYPSVPDVKSSEMAKMYGVKRMNVSPIKDNNIENMVDIMKQNKGISIETKVNELYGHAVGVKSIKVYPNKFVVRVMNPEYGGYQKITSFDNVINMWQITKY